MDCPHSIDEMDTAMQADGICPICQRDNAIVLRAEIERLLAEVKQCSIELGEAAKLLRPHYPRTSGIYDEACGRARVAIGLNPCDDEQKPDAK